MKFPFHKRRDIEFMALELISEYGKKFGAIAVPPIPMEEIIDSHLNIYLRYTNLNPGKPTKVVLGELDVVKKELRVDESLDPDEHPEKEGRCRFTLAHEAGHWRMHRPLMIVEREQPSLFGQSTVEPIVCRTISRKDPIEWQADTFAGYLLMPKDMVLATWMNICGSLKPYVAAGEIADLSSRWGLAEDKTPTVSIARDMAKVFKVSGQSMQIRLAELGLVQMKEGEPELFKD
ncbi:MAG: ImmA/IrrE family metallo-endopeptidase [Deltaproteobacteria bacterium]|nr:ImmA/IrrE family metallo-endopeptidase [Deltaproteobacteria bacterium]